MSIKLSVCIPTYNRAGFLRETLESIAKQGVPEVEIVVSDNASEDNTEQVIEEFRSRFPRIAYDRLPVNQGADANFLNVVSRAKGEYCWLLGSDDKIEDGALRKVLSVLKNKPQLTGMTVNVEGYDAALKKKIGGWFGENFTQDVLFESPEHCFRELFVYFGLLSCCVVKKSLWDEVLAKQDVRKFFNAYVHIYIICSMIQQNKNWMYVHDKCIGWRHGNDSFLNRGYFRRLEIDVLGYKQLIEGLFKKKSPIFNQIKLNVARKHIKNHIKAGKTILSKEPFTFKALSLCFKEYGNTSYFWYGLIPYLIAPAFVLRGLRTFYRLTLKKL